MSETVSSQTINKQSLRGKFSGVALALFAGTEAAASALGGLSQGLPTGEVALRIFLSCTPLAFAALLRRPLFKLPELGLVALAAGYGLFRGSVVYWPLSEASPFEPIAAAIITALWWIVIMRSVKIWGEFNQQFQFLQESGWSWISNELRQRFAELASQEIKTLQSSLLSIVASRAADAVTRDMAAQLVSTNLKNALANISGLRLAESKGSPILSTRSTIKSALSSPRFDLVFVIASYTALSLVGIIQLVGFGRGAVSVFLSCTITAIGALAVGRVGRALGSAPLTLILLAAVAFAGVWIPDLIFTLLGQGSEIARIQILGGGPLTAFTLLAASAVLAKVRSDSEALIAEFAIRLSDRELIDLYIHHSLQSELQSISKLYQESATQDSLRLESMAQDRLEEFSSRDLEGEFQATLRDPRQRLVKVIRAWSPIVQIEAESFLAREDSRSSLACRVVEEAISNSVRYGGATKITVASKLRGSKLELEVRANGRSIQNDVPLGLGQKLLQVATYSWSLANTKEGTILSVSIPFRIASSS